MIDQTKAVIGQTVFFEEFWSNNIIKGKISEIHDDGARVKCECIVDKAGHDRDSFVGTCGGRWENLIRQPAMLMPEENRNCRIKQHSMKRKSQM